MQREPMGRIRARFVFRIADYGTARVCEMDADLVPPSGFECELDE